MTQVSRSTIPPLKNSSWMKIISLNSFLEKFWRTFESPQISSAFEYVNWKLEGVRLMDFFIPESKMVTSSSNGKSSAMFVVHSKKTLLKNPQIPIFDPLKIFTLLWIKKSELLFNYFSLKNSADLLYNFQLRSYNMLYENILMG